MNKYILPLIFALLLPTLVLAQGVGQLEPWLENDPSPQLSATLVVDSNEFTGMGNITGSDVDISAGTGIYTTSGLGTFGSLDVDTLGFDANVISDSANPILIQPNNDVDDYLSILTSANQTTINFVGQNGMITADSGTIDFDNEIITTIGAGRFSLVSINQGSGILGVGTEASTSFAIDVMRAGGSFTRLRSDNVNQNTQTGGMLVKHALTAQAPLAVFFGSSNFGGTSNQLNFGGGNFSFNTATEINFYTAANYTTVTGTLALQIDSNQDVIIPAGDLIVTGQTGNTLQTTTLGNGATTLAITKNVVTLTGHVDDNTLGTITGGLAGQTLTIICTDAKVTITDTDDAGGANTVDLSAAFTSANDTILQLIFDGTTWFEISRSVN